MKNQKKKKSDNEESDNEESDNEESDNEESDNEESDNEKYDNEKSDNEESDNEESDNEENVNKELENENKVLENENKELENENKELENKNKELMQIDSNYKFLFVDYLNHIINFYKKYKKMNINNVDDYIKLLDDYKNNKFYIINSYNIYINQYVTGAPQPKNDFSYKLFINNYGCVYGFTIIRDAWDKITGCAFVELHIAETIKAFIDRCNHVHVWFKSSEYESVTYCNLNELRFKNIFTSKLSPNKIKLISNLPFNDTNSKEINVLFSYLNCIYTYG